MPAGSRIAALAACLAVAAGCSPPHAPARPENVLLITLDTTRADALECYGGPKGATPRLTELAAESLRFENARAVAPLTMPSHASMMTGLFPPRHGVRHNGMSALPGAASTLAEACRSAGMQTAAFVSSLVLDRIYGLDQGFDTWNQPERPEHVVSTHYTKRGADATIAETLRWLDQRDRGRPFFAWVHLYDPHIPYEAPARFLAQAGGSAYLAEVACADAAVGTLLDRLRADGLLERTLVVVVGDHGESLGEHGERTHGAFCYDATLRVPLLVRFPDGWRAGEVEHGVAGVADVLPTVLGALQLAAPQGLDGLDLSAAAPAPDRGVWCECYAGYLNYGWSPLAGWCTAAGKYLASARPEYYDVARDPRELEDVIASHAPEVKAARDAMSRVLGLPALAPDDLAQDPAMVAELRRLGYAAATGNGEAQPSPLAPSDRPSPRDLAAELEPLLVAGALIDEGRYAQAEPMLVEILRTNPRHALARDLLSLALMQLGRFGEAEPLLEERLRLGAQRTDTWMNLAVCRDKRGDAAGAVEAWRRALAIDPDQRDALKSLAELYEREGRAEEAAELRKRLDSQPASPDSPPPAR